MADRCLRKMMCEVTKLKPIHQLEIKRHGNQSEVSGV